MTPREIKDVSASVRQLLGNKARAENRQFDELLRYYAIERFLYRLSKSPYSTQFVLKGALMLVVWESPATRPTSDIDVLGQVENDPERLELVFREVCSQAAEPDGIVFDADNIRGEVITEQAAYSGVRLGIIGRFGQAKVVFHVDVGFGDAVFPAPETFTYPAILGIQPRCS